MCIGCVNGYKDVRKVMTEIALSTLVEANVVGMDIKDWLMIICGVFNLSETIHAYTDAYARSIWAKLDGNNSVSSVSMHSVPTV